MSCDLSDFQTDVPDRSRSTPVLVDVLQGKTGYDDGQSRALGHAVFRHLGARHPLTEKFSRAFSRAVNV